MRKPKDGEVWRTADRWMTIMILEGEYPIDWAEFEPRMEEAERKFSENDLFISHWAITADYDENGQPTEHNKVLSHLVECIWDPNPEDDWAEEEAVNEKA